MPSSTIKAEVDQEDLPDVIPTRLDAQQVLALKLMKRFLNLRYEKRSIGKPPSIYVTKLAVTAGYNPDGLTSQLERFAAKVKFEMDTALAANNGPDERNPSYEPDCINDRWPTSQADRKTLSGDMDYLINAIKIARAAEIQDIAKVFDDLFGERVSKRSMETYAKRVDQTSGREKFKSERGSGTIIPAVATAAVAVVREAVATPANRFHCEE